MGADGKRSIYCLIFSVYVYDYSQYPKSILDKYSGRGMPMSEENKQISHQKKYLGVFKNFILISEY